MSSKPITTCPREGVPISVKGGAKSSITSGITSLAASRTGRRKWPRRDRWQACDARIGTALEFHSTNVPRSWKSCITSRIQLGVNFSIRHEITIKSTVTINCINETSVDKRRFNLETRVAIVRARRALPVGEVLVTHTIERVLTITFCTRPASGASTKVAGRAAIVRASRAVSV
jgi:hypothetical protein